MLVEGPDFICVGMAKAGTGWLTDQLRDHPEFWMPPVAEVGYLGQDIPALRRSRKIYERLRDKPISGRNGQPRKRAADERAMKFLELLAGGADKPRDLERYVAMFNSKGTLKSADVSPGYTMMDQDVVQQIFQRLPALRIVLLLRDPISKVWSHLSMWARNDEFDTSILEDPSRFRAFLERNKMTSKRAFPSRVVAHWASVVPQDAFRYFFFDDIAEKPEQARNDILSFVGADPAKTNSTFAADYNRKSTSQKLELTKPIEAVLLDIYREELISCATQLGGRAKDWPARYGL